jgi:hypothetical protein
LVAAFSKTPINVDLKKEIPGQISANYYTNEKIFDKEQLRDFLDVAEMSEQLRTGVIP